MDNPWIGLHSQEVSLLLRRGKLDKVAHISQRAENPHDLQFSMEPPLGSLKSDGLMLASPAAAKLAQFPEFPESVVPHDHLERSPALHCFDAIFQENLRVVAFARLVLIKGLAAEETTNEKLVKRAPGQEREEVQQEKGQRLGEASHRACPVDERVDRSETVNRVFVQVDQYAVIHLLLVEVDEALLLYKVSEVENCGAHGQPALSAVEGLLPHAKIVHHFAVGVHRDRVHVGGLLEPAFAELFCFQGLLVENKKEVLTFQPLFDIRFGLARFPRL